MSGLAAFELELCPSTFGVPADHRNFQRAAGGRGDHARKVTPHRGGVGAVRKAKRSNVVRSPLLFKGSRRTY